MGIKHIAQDVKIKWNNPNQLIFTMQNKTYLAVARHTSVFKCVTIENSLAIAGIVKITVNSIYCNSYNIALMFRYYCTCKTDMSVLCWKTRASSLKGLYEI